MIYITDFTNLHSNSKIKKQNNQLSHSRNYLKFYKNQNYDNFEKTLKTPSSYVSFGNTTSALLINPFAEGSEEILEFLLKQYRKKQFNKYKNNMKEYWNGVVEYFKTLNFNVKYAENRLEYINFLHTLFDKKPSYLLKCIIYSAGIEKNDKVKLLQKLNKHFKDKDYMKILYFEQYIMFDALFKNASLNDLKCLEKNNGKEILCKHIINETPLGKNLDKAYNKNGVMFVSQSTRDYFYRTGNFLTPIAEDIEAENAIF